MSKQIKIQCHKCNKKFYTVIGSRCHHQEKCFTCMQKDMDDLVVLIPKWKK
jgi:hypothetical protein